MLVLTAACGSANEGDTGNGNGAGTNTQTNTDDDTGGTNDGGAENDPATGENGSPADEDGTLSKAIERGYITVGFANEEPYAYMQADGTLTGEAVEIAKAVLGNLGIEEVRGELTEFSGLISGLQAGRFDVITAGMFVNPTRCAQVAFADPEYRIGEAIAVKAGNPLELRSYEDIGSKEAKVAVMTGAEEIALLEKSGVPASLIIQVPDQNAAISALQAGRVDAITMTGPALQSRLDTANDANLERVADFEQPVIDGESVFGYGASAFRQQDTAFRDAFNTELQKLKDAGELLTLMEPFGFTEEELPGDMTAEALCSE
ncbi:ectoine/hydroxyectoine ABC transporter substrate-binding protein EhuB [Paenibacillaceae bacterium]|nr:ectoine/hydroxyectoine ABC transporter substrate-binding protein EhuB [Paenibacillaceae bacterium]